MKSTLTIFIIFLGLQCALGQRGKATKFQPTYSGCEVQYCLGSRVLSFSDTTKLLAKTCSHEVGCTGFQNAGSWSIKKGIIRIESLPKLKVLSDLNGQFWKIKREDFEILIHETVVADSIKILFEIESGFKETDDYKTFFVEFPIADKTKEKKLKEKLISDYIKTEFTWKYKILIRDIAE